MLQLLRLEDYLELVSAFSGQQCKNFISILRSQNTHVTLVIEFQAPTPAPFGSPAPATPFGAPAAAPTAFGAPGK